MFFTLVIKLKAIFELILQTPIVTAAFYDNCHLYYMLC